MEPVLQRLRGEGLTSAQEASVWLIGGLLGLIVAAALIAQLGL